MRQDKLHAPIKAADDEMHAIREAGEVDVAAGETS